MKEEREEGTKKRKELRGEGVKRQEGGEERVRGISKRRRRGPTFPIILPSLSVMRMLTWSGLGTTPESEVLSTSEKFSLPS